MSKNLKFKGGKPQQSPTKPVTPQKWMRAGFLSLGGIFILGVIGAVAIPGYMHYIQSSKMSEARTNLISIHQGAELYYESEHMDPANPNKIIKNQYPIATTPVLAGSPMNQPGLKHNPSDTNFNEGAWKDLHFLITMPHYYTYSYVSDGKSYVAKAYASLSKECDSIFVIRGENGKVSNIIDESYTADCTPAKLP